MNPNLNPCIDPGSTKWSPARVQIKEVPSQTLAALSWRCAHSQPCKLPSACITAWTAAFGQY